MNSNNIMKILVIGPYPPPNGGVAIYIKNFLEESKTQSKYSFTLHRIGKTRTSNIILRLFEELGKFIVGFMKIRKSDVIYIHCSSYLSFYRTIIYVFMNKAIGRKRLILHIHSGKFDSFYQNSSNHMQTIIRNCLLSASHIIVTSDRWVPFFKKITNGKVAINFIYNSYLPNKFYPINKRIARTQLSIPDTYTMVSIGQLIPVKGFSYLIDALKKIDNSINPYKCYILGEGTSRSTLQKAIDRYHLNDKIILKGEIEHELIPLWINSADVIIIPSLAEGNPTVMFESLGCGKPIIATNIGGIPDILNNNSIGLLIASKNSDDLAKAIDTAYKTIWNNNFIISYGKQFSADAMFTKFLKILNSIY